MFTGIITHLATLKNLEFNAKKDAILILEIEKLLWIENSKSVARLLVTAFA